MQITSMIGWLQRTVGCEVDGPDCASVGTHACAPSLQRTLQSARRNQSYDFTERKERTQLERAVQHLDRSGQEVASLQGARRQWMRESHTKVGKMV